MRWRVVPLFRDAVQIPPAPDPAVETTVTLVQGLKNTRHRLVLTSPTPPPIRALRVFRPPRATSE